MYLADELGVPSYHTLVDADPIAKVLKTYFDEHTFKEFEKELRGANLMPPKQSMVVEAKWLFKDVTVRGMNVLVTAPREKVLTMIGEEAIAELEKEIGLQGDYFVMVHLMMGMAGQVYTPPMFMLPLNTDGSTCVDTFSSQVSPVLHRLYEDGEMEDMGWVTLFNWSVALQTLQLLNHPDYEMNIVEAKPKVVERINRVRSKRNLEPVDTLPSRHVIPRHVVSNLSGT